MVELLIAVLADKNLQKLERCLESVSSQKRRHGKILVINSLDQEFVEQATFLAEQKNYPHIVTESNGTSSRGKNSVLDYFASSDYQYLCQVDGDDYLLPDASEILYRIIESDTELDVLGLTNGLAMTNSGFVSTSGLNKTPEWNQLTMSQVKSIKDAKRLMIFYERARQILEWNRFILVNKKCLSYFRYSENIHISDLQLCFRLKHHANQGTCRYVILDSTDVYMYDITEPGDFAKFLSNNPQDSIKTFWKELEGLDMSGVIPLISTEDF